MAASTTPPRKDRPLRVGLLASALLVATAGVILTMLLGREVVGAGAPPPHRTPHGQPVDARTLLDVGDQVEALSDDQWCDAVVLSTTDDGLVRVHYIGWPSSYDEELTRDRLRFDAEPPGDEPDEEDAGPR